MIDVHARRNEYCFFCHMLGELLWEHRACALGGMVLIETGDWWDQ